MAKKKYEESQLERAIVDTVKITKGIDDDVCDGVRGKYEKYVPEELKKPVVCPVVIERVVERERPRKKKKKEHGDNVLDKFVTGRIKKKISEAFDGFF